MVYDFWNHRINPVTGFLVVVDNPKAAVVSARKKAEYVRTKDLHAFTSGKILSEELGVDLRKVKQLFKSIGATPRVNNGSFFYPTDKIEEIKNICFESENMQDVDLLNYITNVELMQMFGFDNFKAWTIAKKENLTKKRFKGNILYYEREAALIAFSKYKT